MKAQMLTNLLTVAAPLLSLLVLARPLNAWTPAVQEAARPVEITVELPEKITQGEPIVANVTVTNSSGSAVQVNLGWNQVGAFEIEARLPNGHQVTGRAQPPPLGGMSRGPTVTIESARRFSQWLPLSEWVDFGAVGRYELAIRFNGSVLSNKKSDIPVAKEWRRTVEVGPRDPAVLTALCERLEAAILQTANIEQQLKNAAQLAGVRDPLAVPFMKRVAQAGKAQGPMIEGLVAVGTPNAREALVELSQSSDPDAAALSKSALRRFTIR